MLTFLRMKPSKFGGAENYLTRLSRELDRRGVVHTIEYSTAPKFLASWIKVIWYNLESCIKKRDRVYFSLERVICSDIYRAGDGVHKVFLEIEKKSKLNPLHFIYLFIEKRVFKRAKVIIANSKRVRDEIISTYGVDKGKIRVIYNGIPIKPLADSSKIEELKREFKLQDEKILLFVGSGFKRKGVKELLELLSKLNRDVKLFVVGKEKRLGEYQKIAKDLNIKDRVIFTGARGDVDIFYSLADIFIFPTHYEPFSNVVLEAMSFKCAVFTTTQNGASEILDRRFIMESPRDYKVEFIRELIDNEALLREVKEENYRRSKEFTIEKNVDKTLKVIDEVIY